MFTAQRKQIIREAVWKPWRAGRSKEHENVLPSLQSIKHEKLSTREQDIQFLEYWKYENLDAAQPGVNCFAGIIHDEHVVDWLHQQGPFALRRPSPEHKVVGGLRILICEQRESNPLTFPISRDSYLRLEKHFHLSPATLPYFKNSGYSHTWRHITTGGHNELVLITSPPATSPLSGARLSLSHDLNTSITTAFLYGPHLLSAPPAGVTVSGAATSWCARPVPLIPQLRELLDACGGSSSSSSGMSSSLWTHPLLLPTLLLANAIGRTQAFCAHELAARIAAADEELWSTAKQRSGGAEAMMREVSAVAAEAIGVEELCAWEGRIAAWLADMAERTEDLLLRNEEEDEWEREGGGHGGSTCWEMREMVEQLKTAAESGVEEAEKLKTKAGWLVDTLNTAVTQTNNLLAAQLAATTTRDAASVKTMALLTTLFLPAIFVATLITTFTCSTHTNSSMMGTNPTNNGTTNDDNDNNPLLSKNLRTYWATTIPLTVLLLLSWLIWRHRATRLFQADYAAIQRGRDPTAGNPARPPPQEKPSCAPSPTPAIPPPSSSSSSSSSSAKKTNETSSKERAKVTVTEAVDLEDGRVRERGHGHGHGHGHGRGERSRVSALLMPSSERRASRASVSLWPTGPSGWSAPGAVGAGTAAAMGRRGGGQQRSQEDVERLV